MKRKPGTSAPFIPRCVRRQRPAQRFALPFFLSLACLVSAGLGQASLAGAQGELTPLQQAIKLQAARLSSGEVEERRDAVMRLGSMARPEASRAAATALKDPSAIVRATAARAVLSLEAGEATALILPLLSDKDEFVRRETAYALGLSRNAAGVERLVSALGTDKRPSVRGAAAVALGLIGEPAAVPALAAALSRRVPAAGFFNRLRRRKIEEDEFVRRAAAVSLGQIGDRAGVPVLVETLVDERAPNDVRREAARSLGLIADPAAVPALRRVLTHQDPFLSEIAFEALRRIEPATATRPAGGSL